MKTRSGTSNVVLDLLSIPSPSRKGKVLVTLGVKQERKISPTNFLKLLSSCLHMDSAYTWNNFTNWFKSQHLSFHQVQPRPFLFRPLWI